MMAQWYQTTQQHPILNGNTSRNPDLKSDPRRGRKMGHVTFVAPTLVEAQDQLRAACAILGIAP